MISKFREIYQNEIVSLRKKYWWFRLFWVISLGIGIVIFSYWLLLILMLMLYPFAGEGPLYSSTYNPKALFTGIEELFFVIFIFLSPLLYALGWFFIFKVAKYIVRG